MISDGFNPTHSYLCISKTRCEKQKLIKNKTLLNNIREKVVINIKSSFQVQLKLYQSRIGIYCKYDFIRFKKHHTKLKYLNSSFNYSQLEGWPTVMIFRSRLLVNADNFLSNFNECDFNPIVQPQIWRKNTCQNCFEPKEAHRIKSELLSPLAARRSFTILV